MVTTTLRQTQSRFGRIQEWWCRLAHWGYFGKSFIQPITNATGTRVTVYCSRCEAVRGQFSV